MGCGTYKWGWDTMFGNQLSSARAFIRREAVLRRTSWSSSGSAGGIRYRKSRRVAGVAALVGLVGTGLVTGVGVHAAPAPVGSGFVVTAGDISFILKQIKISERHAQAFEGTGAPGFTLPANPDPTHDPQYCSSLVGPGPNQIPDYLTSYGLRTTDGGCNNLVPSALLNPDDSPVINTNNATANGGN